MNTINSNGHDISRMGRVDDNGNDIVSDGDCRTFQGWGSRMGSVAMSLGNKHVDILRAYHRIKLMI